LRMEWKREMFVDETDIIRIFTDHFLNRTVEEFGIRTLEARPHPCKRKAR
jgi:hypothetical protein